MLVQNKGNYSYEANGLVLVPGVNNVEKDAFEKFLKHPLMAYLNGKGEFEYKLEEKKLTVDELLDLINDTFSTEVLEQMKVGEKRKTVLEAIEKRLKELKGEKKG